MVRHNEMTDAELRQRIRRQEIVWGGNATLKLYGTLRCTSGKRLTRKNRVFFGTETEALAADSAPAAIACGMRTIPGNMDLFSSETDTNLLPYNGEVYYYGHVLSQTQADRYLERLLNGIEWKNDEARFSANSYKPNAK